MQKTTQSHSSLCHKASRHTHHWPRVALLPVRAGVEEIQGVAGGRCALASGKVAGAGFVMATEDALSVFSTFTALLVLSRSFNGSNVSVPSRHCVRNTSSLPGVKTDAILALELFCRGLLSAAALTSGAVVSPACVVMDMGAAHASARVCSAGPWPSVPATRGGLPD